MFLNCATNVIFMGISGCILTAGSEHQKTIGILPSGPFKHSSSVEETVARHKQEVIYKIETT